MLTMHDINVIEGEESSSEEDYFSSLQSAINSGSAWSLQGSYGRAMMDAIKSGRCALGRSGTRDYYGNYIPSRDEVQAGTKGSVGFVAACMGPDWADMIERVA